MVKRWIAVFLEICFLLGCIGVAENTAGLKQTNPETPVAVTDRIPGMMENIMALSGLYGKHADTFATKEFTDWLYTTFGPEVLQKLESALEAGTFTDESWYTVTHHSAEVLYDWYSGALDPHSPHYRSDIKQLPAKGENTVIRVVGDVSLADKWKIMPKITSRGKGIAGVVSQDALTLLKSADILLANNEFCYSTRGSALAGKAYTFRANPKNVTYMQELGADIVSVANNHIFDFGKDAFADTLDTLKKAGISAIGGGQNAAEAARPFYFIVNGRKYAFTAATRAEKHIFTPEATENSPGVMRTYNDEKYCKVIAAAEAQCDVNIAYVHWGAENSHKTEDGLYRMACHFIDSGADFVVGAHAHMLQGMAFYKDKPIAYNLGNFIFNAETIDTGILEIAIKPNGGFACRFVPAIQKDCFTGLVEGSEKARILSLMEKLSDGVAFGENGEITQK